jgi:hypothetical protein
LGQLAPLDEAVSTVVQPDVEQVAAVAMESISCKQAAV